MNTIYTIKTKNAKKTHDSNTTKIRNRFLKERQMAAFTYNE